MPIVNKIYWTNFTSDTLWVADISDLANPTAPTNPTLLMSDGNLDKPDGLFIDTDNSKIYWINYNGNTLWVGTISDLANPTTPIDQKLLMSDGNLKSPSGLFLDTCNQKIYWVNSGDNTMWFGDISDLTDPTEVTAPTLLMSDGNGSLNKPSGLFIDEENNKIYWVNCASDTLWVGTISDLANPTTPIDKTLLMSGGNLDQPNDVFVDTNNSKIYWVNFGNNSMWVATISDLENPTTPTDQILLISDVNLAGPSGIFVTTTALAMIYPCTPIVDAGPDQIIGTGSDAPIGVGPALSDILYTWSPSDDINDINAFPTTAAPFVTTTYTVIAERTDVSDCASSDSVTITVSDFEPSVPCTLTISDLSGEPICTNTFFNISFSFSGVSDAHCILNFNSSDYESDFTSGSHSFNVQAPIIASDYLATLSAYNLLNSDCSDVKSTFITVKQRPEVTVSASSDIVCFGNTVTLTASGADTYTWFDGSNDSVHIFTPTISSDYVVTGTSDGCSNDAFVHITVKQRPIVTVAASSDIVCFENTVTLTASGADTYLWFDGSDGSVHTFTPTESSDYIVTGTSDGCSNDAFVHITVDTPVSDLKISASPSDTLCSGTLVTLTASGAHHYVWFDGTSDNPHAAFTPTQNSDYHVTGFSQNEACFSDAFIHITVKHALTVNAGPDQILSSGSVATIGEGSALSDVFYTWSPSDGLSDVHVFPATVTFTSDITYTITASGPQFSDCPTNTIVSDSVTLTKCFVKLSDIHFDGKTLEGFQLSNKTGPRIITATYETHQ